MNESRNLRAFDIRFVDEQQRDIFEKFAPVLRLT